jgi:hypothetical protein
MIEVLKQAYQLLLTEPHAPTVCNQLEVIFRRAIAELESQEPVEWGVDWGKDGNSVSIIKRLANGNIEVLAWEYAPHPPQRTWVGLTDEETEAIWYAFHDREMGYAIRFAKAIEAKLKEKNNVAQETDS